ncbi:hypothetical protein SeMB42_g06171 [Synchytrium endobioticum]|uniref:Large ribosomal subunit protein mL43 n=1 Tax=Synchytrium endobioticum TaxID=286115 RepID=A0A507CFU1_9FUNG|nr:hypothetical protein SeMB42_g06171 [Synchytrium endobioticum]TPX45128.1 hypothetical protein SeLEV6574_g04076 [Synchytrium endobioticum]
MGYHPAKQVLENISKTVKKVLPVQNTVSRSRNGSVTYTPPLQHLHIYYDHPRLGGGGTSKGLVDWIHANLIPFAYDHPHVEIAIQNRKQLPPEILGVYNTGHEKRIIVKGLDRRDVHKKIMYLAETSGGPDRSYPLPVLRAKGEGVDPVWNPFNAEKTFHP